MEYLQYQGYGGITVIPSSFKPCYKWNTFNTVSEDKTNKTISVLNLVISGIPSIHW